MRVAVARVVVKRRDYFREVLTVRLRTTPGIDGHVHVATVNDDGNGWTDEVSGHVHRVRELEFELGPDGHSHDIAGRAG